MSMNADRLGAALYQAVRSVDETQETAGPGLAEERWKAIAAAIIAEIQANATIASLSTTSTPTGTGPHVHDPATVSSTGKIS